MESLGRFPRVLHVLPREKIEGPSKDFLNANSRTHSRPDQRPKTRGAAGPECFWPLVWPRMWMWKIPNGAFNILPREYIKYSSVKGPAKGSIYNDTSEAFPKIFILFT